MLTKELVKKLTGMKGECRGIHLRNDAQYILMLKGKKGLLQVERELKNFGFLIKYNEIKNMEFYPAGWRIISLLAVQKVFNWSEDDIQKMCSFSAGVSFIIKLYMKFFYSIPKVLEKASKMWQEYWTDGRLIVKNHDEKKKQIVIRIEDFVTHPIYCRCLEGYFRGLTKMVTKTKNPECKEIKCSKENHEFVIKY